MIRAKTLLISWIIVSVALFFYSFTQVDLSLTLSRASIWQSIQTSFQYVGYFNRTLSTYWYIGILIGFFIAYILTIRAVHKKNLDRRKLWTIIIVVSGILFLSYNAFSYDLFNYIFDAKIFTFYGQNPYHHKALDFYEDPMLSFMRWTHRVYPYGPTWLVVTIPFSFIGMQIFLITFYLFKLIALASFLGTIYFLEKLARMVKKDSLAIIAIFALNPLALIESLVSAHNDIVMLFFAVLSLYLLYENKKVLSLLSILFSVGIKFVTAFLLPVYLVYFINKKYVFHFGLLLMVAGTLAVTFRSTFQPWYLLYPMLFAPFFYKRIEVIVFIVILSIAGLLQYVPFLYTGNWDPPIPTILNLIMVGGIGIATLISVLLRLKNVIKQTSV